MYGNRWLLKFNFSIGGLDRNYCKKTLNIQQLLEILHVLVGNSVSHFYVHINARHNHSMLSVLILKQLNVCWMEYWNYAFICIFVEFS